jgi:hypothetical protein
MNTCVGAMSRYSHNGFEYQSSNCPHKVAHTFCSGAQFACSSSWSQYITFIFTRIRLFMYLSSHLIQARVWQLLQRFHPKDARDLLIKKLSPDTRLVRQGQLTKLGGSHKRYRFFLFSDPLLVYAAKHSHLSAMVSRNNSNRYM